MIVDGLAQHLGQLAGAGAIGVRTDQQELLATPAADGVGGARAGPQQLRQLDQYLVARLVAMLVVDQLEMVDVDQDDAEGMAEPDRLMVSVASTSSSLRRLYRPVRRSVMDRRSSLRLSTRSFLIQNRLTSRMSALPARIFQTSREVEALLHLDRDMAVRYRFALLLRQGIDALVQDVAQHRLAPDHTDAQMIGELGHMARDLQVEQPLLRMAWAATISERIVRSALRSETSLTDSCSLPVRTTLSFGYSRRIGSSTMVPRGKATVSPDSSCRSTT